jgi:hypothetical protein
MPIFNVTSPDGRTIEVNAPEGATEDQAIKYAQDNWESLSKTEIKKTEAPAAPAENPSLWDKYINLQKEGVGSVVEPALNMASGIIAKPVSDIAGLAATGYEALTGNKNSADMPEQFQQYVKNQLTYEPRTVAGKSNLNPLVSVPKAASAVLGKIGETGADVTRAVLPEGSVTDGIARGVQEAIPQAIGIGMAKFGQKNYDNLPERQAQLDILKQENAAKDAIRVDANKINLVAPSEHGVKQFASSLTKSNQIISNKNAIEATRAVKDELGLPKAANLSKDTLNSERMTHYDAYQKIVDEAGVNGLQLTPTFKQSILDNIQKLEDEYKTDSQTFVSNPSAIKLLEEQLQNPVMDSGKALTKIKTLRAQSRKGFSSDDPIQNGLAKTRLETANAIEGLFEENLVSAGKPGLVDKMREARTKLAQINYVEDIVDPSGLVNLQKAGTLGKKIPTLSGNLKTISDFANTFKEGAANPTTKGSIGYWDAMLASGALGAGHVGLAATEILGRGGIPILAGRGMLQNKLPTYQVGNMYKSSMIGTPYGLGMNSSSLPRDMLKKEQQ